MLGLYLTIKMRSIIIYKNTWVATMSINHVTPSLTDYDLDSPNARALRVSLDCVAMPYAKAPWAAFASLGCSGT